MFAKDYLNQIRFKTERIVEQEEYIFRLRQSLGIAGIDYSKDKIQTSPTDRTSEIIAKIVDEEVKLNEMKQNLIQFRIDVIDMIRQLNNENHKKILNTVYVDLHNLKECSKVVGFSYDYTRELHVDALKAFEEKFPQYQG